MKHFYVLLALVGFGLVATAAQAQTTVRWNEDLLTWVPGATCADGSPATDCPITSFRIETASSATAPTWSLVTTTDGVARAYKTTGLTAGVHCYRLAAIGPGGQSPFSTVTTAMCPTAAQPAPGAPTLTVTDVVAFEIRENAQGILVATRIGILPAGSPCNQPTREANGVTYQSVDPSSVEPFNALQAVPQSDVFARCAGS